MFYQTKCKNCGAPIIFGYTKNGKRIPLDAEPQSFVECVSGDVFFEIVNDQAIYKRGVVAMDDGPDTTVGYRSHFATCELRPKGKNLSEAEYRSQLEDLRVRRREREELQRREAEAAEAKRRAKEEKEAADREAASMQYSFFSI